MGPGEAEERDRHRKGGDRHPLRQPVEGVDAPAPELEYDQARPQEGCALHDRVVDDVEERPRHPELGVLDERWVALPVGVDHKADEYVACLRDAGVREEARHALLGESGEVPECHRRQREDREDVGDGEDAAVGRQ